MVRLATLQESSAAAEKKKSLHQQYYCACSKQVHTFLLGESVVRRARTGLSLTVFTHDRLFCPPRVRQTGGIETNTDEAAG